MLFLSLSILSVEVNNKYSGPRPERWQNSVIPGCRNWENADGDSHSAWMTLSDTRPKQKQSKVYTFFIPSVIVTDRPEWSKINT